MLLAYLDESYQRGKGYWLGVCAVPDENVAEMCRAMRAATRVVPSGLALPDDTELHAQHLYHGDGDFSGLKRTVRLRVQVFDRGLDAVLASCPSVFFVGVEWNEDLLEHSLTTHRLTALRRLLNHLERFCVERGEQALIVADEEETSASEVVAVVRRHQHRHGSCADRSRILEAPLFTPSHWSYGVQGSDLVTFVNSRRCFGRDDGRPEDPRVRHVLDSWWRRIEERVAVWEFGAAPLEIDSVLSGSMQDEP